MKKLGKRLGIIGLIIGIFLGLSLLVVQNYIAKELRMLLEEEVAKSCAECSFAVDGVRVSLLTLSAKAENARILENEEVKLFFDKIKLTFGLKDYKKNIIYLNQLDLIDGHAYGVSEKSVTFRFIDHLATPSDEEKKDDDLELILLGLRVFNSGFTEQLGSDYLEAKGVSLVMKRNEREDFTLHPKISDLSLYSNNNPKQVFPIGKIAAELDTYDEKLAINQIQLDKNTSNVKGQAAADYEKDNELQGEIELELASDAYNLNDFITLIISGKGKVSGKLGNPTFTADFKANKKLKPKITISDIELIELDQVSGRLKADFAEIGTNLSITNVKASNKNSTINSIEAITIDADKISGKLAYKLGSIKLPDYQATDVRGEISLAGNLNQPIITLSGNASSLSTSGFTFKNTKYNFKSENDQYQIDLKHNSFEQGSMKLDATLFNNENQQLEIKKFTFDFNDYAFIPNEIDYIDEFLISGNGNLKGLFQADSLIGEGKISLASRHFAGEAALKGTFKVDQGQFKLNLENPSNTIKTDLKFSIRERDRGAINLTLNDFKLNEYYPDLECIQLSLDSTYRFSTKKLLLGSGKIDLKKLNFGCDPYTIQLSKTHNVKIQNGTMELANVEFKGEDTNLKLNGALSTEKGFAVKANGNLQFQALTKLIPIVDDLRGAVEANLDITGPLLEPDLIGTAEIDDLEFVVESFGITGSNISGNLVFDGKNIHVNDLSGLLNDGKIESFGFINPVELEASDITLAYKDFEFYPNDQLSIGTSGSLNLTQGEYGQPVLSGEIDINHATFRKDFSLRAAFNVVKDYLLKDAEARYQSVYPEVDLDINLKADRNIFVISNLIETELNADVKILGNLKDPQFNGELNSLYGWFGLKNSRFDLTSGKIFFRPNSIHPLLDILAETSVINRLGEPIYIALEATGPMTDPQVNLSSDNNLNEKEILTLLTTRGLYRAKTQASTIGVRASQDLVLVEDDGSIIRKLLSGLTSIDSISLEPAFNISTGLIEPTLIATKRLGKRLSLSGESFLGGSTNDSRVRATYDINQFLSVAGIFDAVTTQENTAVGVDLTYTVLERRKPFLKINLSSTEELDQEEFLKNIRITEDTKIPEHAVASLNEIAQSYLIRQGYLEAKTDINCEIENKFCKTLDATLEPGKRYIIDSIDLTDDQLPDELDVESILELREQEYASEEFRINLENKILNSLRSEGYIKARIKSEYILDGKKINLRVKLHLSNPVSFSFIGNKRFEVEELLDTINLFRRKQPFGNNTINILVENIEKLYRENGYLFTTITYQELENLAGEGDRTHYVIFIDEEEVVDKIDVEIAGLKNVSLENLEEKIQTDDLRSYNSLFKPKYAIAEEIESNIFYLEDIFSELGYPNVSISFQYITHDELNRLTIKYLIDEGERLKLDKIEIIDFPEHLNAPSFEQENLSYVRVNRYINIILDSLSSNGYLDASLFTELDFESNKILVYIETNQVSRIGNIQCIGNKDIKCETILERIAIQEGEQYSRNKINQAEGKLLRLGLFSSIDVTPVDGEIDSETEDLEVRISERPLQSLDIGVGLNSELGLHVFSEATDKSLFKDGKTLSLRLDAYYDDASADISQGVAGLRYTDPNFLDTNFKLSKDYGFQKFDNPTLEYDLDRAYIDTSIYKSWGSGLGMTLGHTFSNEDLNQVTPGAILSDLDEGKLFLSYVYGNLTYDLRDDPINPRSGAFFGLDYKFATESIASDANYYSANGRFAWLIPVFDSRFTIANNSILGASWTFDETEIVPITQRFYLGGRNTIRGFRENSLGPRGEDGAVIGGDVLIGNNFEVRYLADENLSLHTFLDSGNVFLRDQTSEFDHLRVSTGIGFRYISPIGPIGFDFGHPLDEKEGEPSWRVHFSVGSSF